MRGTNGMGNSILPLRRGARKSPRPGNEVQHELKVRAVQHAIWMAVVYAQDAGLPDVAERLGPVHLDVVRRLHQLQEVA